MPKKDGYVCECGSKQANLQRLQRHQTRFCSITTTGSGKHGKHDTMGNTEGNTSDVSLQNPNNDAELTGKHGVGKHGKLPYSPSSLPKEREGNTEFPVFPVFPIEDPRARERDAVTYLSARTDYLDPKELRFYLGVRHQVLGGANHLTERQRDWLFEIEAVVQGLEAEDARYKVDTSRARHHLDVKDPAHPKDACEFCAEEVARAVAAQESFNEQQAWFEERAKEVDAARRAGKPIPRPQTLPGGRSSQITPKAPRFTPKEEGPDA